MTLKTEIIIFGSSDKAEFNNSVLGNLSVFNSNCVRNLGVLIDSRLTLDKHVPPSLPLVSFSFVHSPK